MHESYRETAFTINMTVNPEEKKKCGTTEIAIHGTYDVIMIIRHDHIVSYHHQILFGRGA